MKQILSFLACTILFTNLFAQKVDTAVTDQWNGSAWEHYSRSIATYDGNCVLQTTLSQNWQSGSSTWADTLLFTYSYNSNNQPTEILGQFWDGGSWVNTFRTRNVYNGTTQLLDTSYGDLWQSNSWQTFTRTTYTYNSDNTVYQSLGEIYLINTWSNLSQTTYSYNADKTVNFDSLQTWQPFPPKWVNSLKDTNTYNGSGKLISKLQKIWKNNKWSNSILDTYTLDGNGNVSIDLEQSWNSGTSAWDNEYQSTYHYNNCGSLPLTLLNFTASKNNNTVSLNWQTANEVNTSHFTIQRSFNGTDFTDIGKVNAKGSNNLTNNYTYSDDIASFKTGTVYYRLQMVDKDGKTVTSKIVTVRIGNGGIEFSIRPNPAKNFIIITTDAILNGNAVISITDFVGHVVLKQTITTSGEQRINISALQKGVYIVSIKTTDAVTTKKLVVE